MFPLVSSAAVVFAVLGVLWHMRQTAPTDRASPLGRAALTVCWIGLTAMTLTAYVAIIGFGELRGWLLLTHTAAAPVFLAGLAGSAVLPIGSPPGRGLLFLAGLISAASILAAMSPWFGYSSQELLITVHRYSAAGLLAAWLMLTVGGLAKPRKRVEEVSK